MKQTINEYQFRRGFEQSRPDNFSYEALGILFEYFQLLEEDIDQEIEYDIIAICCDYAESTVKEINNDYDQEFESLEEASEWLQDETIVAGSTETTVIYQQF